MEHHKVSNLTETFLKDYLDFMDFLPNEIQRYLTRLCEIDAKYNDQSSSIHCSETLSKLSIEKGESELRSGGHQPISSCTNSSSPLSNQPNNPATTSSAQDPKSSIQSSLKKPLTSSTHVSPATLPSKKSSRKLVKTSYTSEAYRNGCTKGVNKSSEQPYILTSPNVPAVNTTNNNHTSATIAKNSGQHNNTPLVEKRMSTRKKKKQREVQNLYSDYSNHKKVKKSTCYEDEFVGEPVDPNEPIYCICNRVSFGEMICCDYEGCELEWFHFECVSLNTKPKGRWFCPNCRQDTNGKHCRFK